MYLFLSIFVWPFTRAFARFMDRSSNNLKQVAPDLHHVLTKSRDEEWGAITAFSVVYTILLIELAIITMNTALALKSITGVDMIFEIVGLIVSCGIFAIMIEFIRPDNSPIRHSWRRRHERVFVSYSTGKLPTHYDVFTGTFAGYLDHLRKLNPALAPKLTDDGDNSVDPSSEREVFDCLVSIPTSWAFGQKPHYSYTGHANGRLSIRPTKYP